MLAWNNNGLKNDDGEITNIGLISPTKSLVNVIRPK